MGLDGGKVPIGPSGFPGTDCTAPSIGVTATAPSDVETTESGEPTTETTAPKARALGPAQVPSHVYLQPVFCIFVSDACVASTHTASG